MITAIIIDDEAHARAAIKGISEDNIPELSIIGEAKNLPDGVKMIRQLNPNVVFLDIEMPGYSGLEILDFFGDNEINFHIIFVTAYNEYALNAFQLSAIDYLVKPVQLEDIKRSLKKIGSVSSHQMETLKSNLSTENQNHKIIVTTSGNQLILELNNIIYIKADGSYCDIILTNGEKICVTKRISEFDKIQDFPHFMRIHRSHIVNIKHITKIVKSDGGFIQMVNGDELSISKDKKQELEKSIASLII